MKHFFRVLLIVALTLVAVERIQAQSTINPNVPATNSALASAPIRSNFTNAYNDVNGILNMHAVATLGACLSQPLVGTDCLVLASASQYLWYKYMGVNGYSLIGTINPSTTPPSFTAAIPAIPNGSLIANCSGATAVPTGCTWNNFANQAIGNTNGMIPYNISGAWGTISTGTSGGTIPLNNTANIFSAVQTINLNGAALPSPDTGTGLQVGGVNATISRIENTAFGAPSNFTGRRSDGTNASPTAVTTNDVLVSYNANGYFGSGWTTTAGASVDLTAAQPWTSSNQGTYIDIKTTPNNSTVSSLATVCRFNNDGGVTCPNSVTGGDEGAGTVNVGGGYYVAGVQMATFGTAGTLLQGAGITSTPTFSATPTLGVAGTTVGTISFANATSGAITISPPTGALGSVTNTLQAVADTFVYRASTDTLTNKTLTSSTDVIGGVTMTLGSDANGDMYYRNSGVLTRLPVGGAGQVIGISAGLPAWVAASAAGSIAVASTTVTGGTTGFVLFNNAGVLGNETIASILTAGTGISITGTTNATIAVSLPDATNSLGADAAISNSIFSPGPSMAQGTSGKWHASGTVTLLDTVGNAQISCKLWDGTTVIDSGRNTLTTANASYTMSLSGDLASPAANIRIDCTSNASGATSTFKANSSGQGKDSTITGFRIG